MTTRQCTACLETKAITEFHANRTKRSGVQSQCKRCVNARVAAWQKGAGRERWRGRQLERNYGVDLATYKALVAEQGGVCAICGKAPSGKRPALAVDHDHTTGEVRGLLCRSCNVALGHFRDDERRLKAAVRYLETHEKRTRRKACPETPAA